MIRPFHGFLPVPILPASQVAATSYEQHLAYIEWYMNYLAGEVNKIEEDGPAYHPALIQAYGLAADPGSQSETVPLFEDIKIGEKLSVSNSKIIIGAGVNHVRISGQCGMFYTSSAAATCSMEVQKNGTRVAFGTEYTPVGASAVLNINIPGKIIAVAEGDELIVKVNNMYTGFSDMNATPTVLVEVID